MRMGSCSSARRESAENGVVWVVRCVITYFLSVTSETRSVAELSTNFDGRCVCVDRDRFQRGLCEMAPVHLVNEVIW